MTAPKDEPSNKEKFFPRQDSRKQGHDHDNGSGGQVNFALEIVELHERNRETSERQSNPGLVMESLENNNPKQFSEVDCKEKFDRVLAALGKTIAFIALLFLFVCSLDLLSSSFRLLGGRTTGQIFQQNYLFQNPVVGVMIGVLTTVLVQSSSTSSSIVVSMVSANFLSVPIAIPIIMGANIGTSVTNTVVSMAQMGDGDKFRRAFAAATLHDMFNWLCVIVLLPVEVLSRRTFGQGLLEAMAEAVTKHIGANGSSSGGQVKLFNALTEPITKRIIQIDDRVLEGWSKNDSTYLNASLIKRDCNFIVNDTEFVEECSFLMRETNMNDTGVGLVLLMISLLALCSCLVGVVKILHSALKGQIADLIKQFFNTDVPYVPWATDYLAIVIGAIVTFLVQSSSVFTSVITPLAGVGVITVERIYPLTLGSNIGTTTTSIIAAMAAPTEQLRFALQIALCHLFFNSIGILLFFPLPMTRFPVPMAKRLGSTTEKYRWFAIAFADVSHFAGGCSLPFANSRANCAHHCF